MGLLLRFFGTSFLMLFTREPEVIETGMKRLGIMAFSYLLLRIDGQHHSGFTRSLDVLRFLR